MSKQRDDGLYPYQPSNGSEGAMFMARFCDRCKRDEVFQRTQDGDDGCPIVLGTMRYNTTDKAYPPEWVADDAVGLVNPRCTVFEAVQAAQVEEHAAHGRRHFGGAPCLCKLCKEVAK